ncbi:MAG: hypothetical protein BGO99_10245 [Nitrosospira sp. 56-18]|nr:MAG: hypothetical protein BGO99_10245 [Nitrosospira sp. 56-18]
MRTLDTCFRRYDEHENCTVFFFLAVPAMKADLVELRHPLPFASASVRLVLRRGKQGTDDWNLFLEWKTAG